MNGDDTWARPDRMRWGIALFAWGVLVVAGLALGRITGSDLWGIAGMVGGSCLAVCVFTLIGRRRRRAG